MGSKKQSSTAKSARSKYERDKKVAEALEGINLEVFQNAGLAPVVGEAILAAFERLDGDPWALIDALTEMAGRLCAKHRLHTDERETIAFIRATHQHAAIASHAREALYESLNGGNHKNPMAIVAALACTMYEDAPWSEIEGGFEQELAWCGVHLTEAVLGLGGATALVDLMRSIIAISPRTLRKAG